MELLKEHERQIIMTKLRAQALAGKSSDFLGQKPAAEHARKLLVRMRTADLQKKKGSKERVGSKEPVVKARQVM